MRPTSTSSPRQSPDLKKEEMVLAMTVNPHVNGPQDDIPDPPHPVPRWPLAAAVSAGLAAWRVSGDSHLGVEVAGLTLLMFRAQE